MIDVLAAALGLHRCAGRTLPQGFPRRDIFRMLAGLVLLVSIVGGLSLASRPGDTAIETAATAE